VGSTASSSGSSHWKAALTIDVVPPTPEASLQWGTIRNLLMAWVPTLPASIALSGALFFLFRHAF
jgi:phosphate/sulfate permease